MFSSTVLCGNRLNCWKTIPMSARMRVIDFERGSMSRPSKRTLPESTCSRPLMQRSIVDLPDPDGPAMTTASPEAIDRLTPSSTRFEPKLLRTSRSSTSGAAGAVGIGANLFAVAPQHKRCLRGHHGARSARAD